MARITGETPLERLTERLMAANAGTWLDEDGTLIYHDQKSNTLHMVEIRTFDITGVEQAERPAARERFGIGSASPAGRATGIVRPGQDVVPAGDPQPRVGVGKRLVVADEGDITLRVQLGAQIAAMVKDPRVRTILIGSNA